MYSEGRSAKVDVFEGDGVLSVKARIHLTILQIPPFITLYKVLMFTSKGNRVFKVETLKSDVYMSVYI